MKSSGTPILYFDLGSPYAYLAAERAAEVLGAEPRFEPILVGGIFIERGYGSWSKTSEREKRMLEVEARASRYGLPPVAWPAGWPNNTLTAMRAAIWADRQGFGRPFALAAFKRAFAEGRDLSRLDEVVDVAAKAGLPARHLPLEIEKRELKDMLRERTARAWSQGVMGVPSVKVSGQVFYGDDQLEAAAQHLARAREGAE